ncbi:hypothetical protein AB0903_21770 [Streptomyces sp. NPDC048389]|uniref:hypothetical protein n=1 Tax=Streptomyces sp. NPDC048389 TaxID=3154622 RepID=UPI0034572A2F
MENVFEPATGDGPLVTGPGRDAEVRTAFEGLLGIRRVTNATGGESVPASWELNRTVRAVSLALEANGFPPSAVAADDDTRRTATGYRVRPGERARTVYVEWLGPPGGGAAQEEESRLKACAEVLAGLGWEGLLYRGPRKRRFLEVEPGGVPGAG